MTGRVTESSPNPLALLLPFTWSFPLSSIPLCAVGPLHCIAVCCTAFATPHPPPYGMADASPDSTGGWGIGWEGGGQGLNSEENSPTKTDFRLQNLNGSVWSKSGPGSTHKGRPLPYWRMSG